MITETANSDPIDELVAAVRAAKLPPPPRERRRIRNVAGVSLRDAAQALGVTNLTVSRWERGIAEPKHEHATRYRRLLDALTDAAS